MIIQGEAVLGTIPPIIAESMTPGLGQEHCVFFKEGKKLDPLRLLSLLIGFSAYCEVWLLLPRYNPAQYTTAVDSVKRKTKLGHWVRV